MTAPTRDKDTPVDRDVPLRLSTAAEIAFPLGGMTASGLRREALRGNLLITRIAGKDFTTLRAIDEMFEKCRVIPRASASTFAATKPPPPPGSSATAEADIALAAALLSVDRLSEPSPPISPTSTGRSDSKR